MASLFHIVHTSFYILQISRAWFDFHYRLSSRSRVKYLTLESKRIIAIISRAVHTSLPAISRTSFANFSWWFAKTEREFWSIRRIFYRRCTSWEKRSALLSNLINILRRDCNSTLFRTITMSSKFLGISIFLRKFIVFISKTRKLRAEVRTERFEVAMLHTSGYLNYDINTQDSSSDKMKEETY